MAATISRSKLSRSAKALWSMHTCGMPAFAARSKTLAPGRLPAMRRMSTSSTPWAALSIMDWALVPLPEARMAIFRAMVYLCGL